MAKTREQMTLEERIDDLRRDLKRTMQVNQTKAFAAGTADEVEALRAKIRSWRSV